MRAVVGVFAAIGVAVVWDTVAVVWAACRDDNLGRL